MSEESAPTVVLTQQEGYQFDISFTPTAPHVLSDEPPPLGLGAGPSPAHLLLAAVGNCMSSSLYFALSKFKNDPQGMTTTARAQIGRNEAGRLRVLHIDVAIRMGAKGETLNHVDRILGQFEEFCTVGQSVRNGIPIDVSVYDGSGQKLK
ncbi:MAG: OsmC family protein [Proteobacteria bacterium]|nr:OsmC family protein [Pseudomonadota bacterium]